MRRDKVLSRVHQYLLHGWPTAHLSTEPQQHKRRERELSTERVRILWRYHESHPGMARMKAIARTIVWWPLIDQDIERVVNNCTLCQEQQNPLALIHSWGWTRLHADYAGLF